jgi:hypothetical protein
MTKKKVKVVGKGVGDKNREIKNGSSGTKPSTHVSPWIHVTIVVLAFLAGVMSRPLRYYILLRNDVGENRYVSNVMRFKLYLS